MLISRFVAWMFVLAAGMALGVGVASGQNYPARPIRIVTAAVGGGTDFVARLVAQGLSPSLGQPLIVDNRTSGVIPGDIVSKSPADGYTLLVTATNFWLGPFLRKLPYDINRDFLAVIHVGSTPTMLLAHPSVPAGTVKELIALAKAKPGELNYGSSSIGSSVHLSMELFKAMAGVNIVHVPYKGSVQASNAVIGGQVQLKFASAGSSMPYVKSGKLKGLAVSSAQPSVLAPGMPTVAASGLPGFEAITMYGMYVPAKTPAAVIGHLNQTIERLIKTPDAEEKMFRAGVDPAGGSPEQFAAAVKADAARWGKLIKDLGIQED